MKIDLKSKYWLPILALYFFYSLFFIKNTSNDVRNSLHGQTHKKSLSVNDLGEETTSPENHSFVNLKDFEAFLFGFGKQPFYKHFEFYIDTTGDGKKELVKETIWINDDVCEVNQEIYKEGNLIWKNSFQLNSRHLQKYFSNHNVIENIETYALFYLGLTFSPFVDKMTLNTTSDDWNKRMIRNYLKDSELSLNEMYRSDIGKRIMNYKGYFIFKRNDGYNSIYMWNEDEKEFMEIHDNNNFST